MRIRGGMLRIIRILMLVKFESGQLDLREDVVVSIGGRYGVSKYFLTLEIWKSSVLGLHRRRSPVVAKQQIGTNTKFPSYFLLFFP